MVKSKKSRGYRDSSRVRKHHKLFADFRFELAFLFRMNSFAMDKENNHKRAYGFARNAMVQYKLGMDMASENQKKSFKPLKIKFTKLKKLMRAKAGKYKPISGADRPPRIEKKAPAAKENLQRQIKESKALLDWWRK